MLSTGGSVNKIHGSSHKIHVLRTKIRVLFCIVFQTSLKDETPLVFSILGEHKTSVKWREILAGLLRFGRVVVCFPPQKESTSLHFLGMGNDADAVPCLFPRGPDTPF